MMTTRKQRRRAAIRRRRSRRIRALLAAGVVLGVGASGTLAAWNDSEYAASTFTAGTFSIVSRAGTGAFTAHDSTANALTVPLNATGLYPGQKRAALVQVQAGGDVGGQLTLDAVTVMNAGGGVPSAANDLALRNALVVGVKVTSASAATPPSCTTSTVPDAAVTGLHNLPSLAAQTLAASGGNTVSYCIVIELPTAAPSAAQGGNIRAYWTFLGTTG